jgi:hypothetical protein
MIPKTSEVRDASEHIILRQSLERSGLAFNDALSMNRELRIERGLAGVRENERVE